MANSKHQFSIRQLPKKSANITNPSMYRVVSMFAGCGGLDLGFLGGFRFKKQLFSTNPFSIASASEYDEKAIQTYRQNIGEHIERRDLSRFDAHDLPSADVLIGGFPCQDFSSCGPKVGLSSDRGKLYKALVKYMNVHQPKVVVAENVPHLEKIGGGLVLKKILKDFEAAGPGYKFKVWKLYAPDFGVPQSRTRLFIVGVRSDIDDFPIQPTPSHLRHLSIDWALSDLEGISDESVANQSQYFKASRAKKGNGQGDEKSRSGEPSYTVRANAKSRVQFHYSLERRLTVRECARLQTFPDSFVFPHSATTNIMQIGNAVPPVLAHTVAANIAEFLRGLNLSATSRAHEAAL